jgi:hypothetical protein
LSAAADGHTNVLPIVEIAMDWVFAIPDTTDVAIVDREGFDIRVAGAGTLVNC